MTRYVPSRHYLFAGLAAVLLGAFSAWWGGTWPPAYLAATLFALSATFLLWLWRRPTVSITETHLTIGRRSIQWTDIRRVDRKGWPALLVARLTLFDNTRIRVVFPGDVDSSSSLLRHLRRNAREALIDGKPYRQFWGENVPGIPDSRTLASPRYRLLLPEDEAEVERLYQRLKTVRHLDPDNSGDEK